MSPSQPDRNHYPRFSRAQRFEHVVLVVAFIGLALTGLPQRYARHEWAKTLIDLLGGIESMRIVHRFMAIVLIAEAIYHSVAISFNLRVLKQRASLVPRWRDFRDAWDWLRHNLGLKVSRPQMPYFNFGEKWDYWVTVLGTLTMVITGFLMWNPIAATRILSGKIIPAARSIHSNEAVFLVLAIATWHLYSAFIKQFNLSMFRGTLSYRQMAEEHGEALAAIEAGEMPGQTAMEAIARRKGWFYLVAGAVVALLVAGLVWFATFEDTAINTVPRQKGAILLPVIPLETGDATVGEAIWPTLRCARCHGNDAAGIPELGPSIVRTRLTFEEFYLQVREGRREMPAIGREDISDAYLLHVWTWLASSVAE
jgi:formate dehydrogenase gamma subunit